MRSSSDDSSQETALTRTSGTALQRLATNLQVVERVLIRNRTPTVVGVDFGLHDLTVALWEEDAPRILPTLNGDDAFPSFVAFKESGERLVGHPAKRQAFTNPEGTISLIRQCLDRPEVKVFGRTYAPQEILASVLRKIKEVEGQHLETELEGAVIAVPNSLPKAQRALIREAGEIAELPVRGVIGRSIATASSYCQKRSVEDSTLVHYDLTRGGFGSSVVQRTSEEKRILSHRETADISEDSVRERLRRHIASKFEQETGGSIQSDSMAQQRLREAATEAMNDLSTSHTTTVDVPFLAVSDEDPLHLNLEITRSAFEKLIAPLVKRTETLTRKAIGDAGLDSSEIDEVILTGSGARIPSIRRRVVEIVGQKPTPSIDSEKVVAFGAAVQATHLSGLNTGSTG